MASINPVHFRALRELSLIFSKALAESAEVFRFLELGELPKEAAPAEIPLALTNSTAIALDAERAPPAERQETPPPLQLVPGSPERFYKIDEIAASLGMTMANVYRLRRENLLPGLSLNNGRLGVHESALQAFKATYRRNSRKVGVGKEAAASPTEKETPVVAERAPELFDLSDLEKIKRQVSSLEEEITELDSYLLSQDPDARLAQLNSWAGTFRKLNEAIDELPLSDEKTTVRQSIWRLLNTLRALSDRFETWISALQMDWALEDWDLYIKATTHPRPTLSSVELETYLAGCLRVINSKSKSVPPSFAKKIIDEASTILPRNQPALQKAQKTFAGRSEVEPAAPPKPLVIVETPKRFQVQEEVLAITRGKRVIMVGGQRSEDQKVAEIIEAFELKECEWLMHERNKAGSMSRYLNRISQTNYDLMFYLANFSGHATMKLQTRARLKDIPVVMLSKGYGVGGISQAILEQLGPGVRRERPYSKAAAANGHGAIHH